MNILPLFGSLLLFLATILAQGPRPLDDLAPTAASVGAVVEQAWTSFRLRFPFHTQGFALAPEGVEPRVLIVAEPPPGMTKEDFARILEVPVEVRSHPIGHDGWVRDVVAAMPQVPAAVLDERLALLAQAMFGTTYGATAIPLPPPPAHPVQQGYDLRIRADELRTWVDGAIFTPLVGGSGTRGVTLLDEGRPGVFCSGESGLVLWVLPKGADLVGFRVEARQWAVESDLVVGAVEGKAAVGVLGRRRLVDVLELPPLRFETMLRLASVGEDEVQQSYERNHVFAGRYDQTRDWAPIYLSDALVDTEYGSLLNITDQLLKSWSMNGTVAYERFDYPKPPFGWPPFEKPLIQLLGAEGSLTFNWNTKGVGYLTGEVDRRVLAVERTGALSVSYLPEVHEGADDEQPEVGGSAVAEPAAAATFEDRGYEFFATCGDPNLSRALQYALLFQVFHAFGVTGTDPTPRILAGGWLSALQPAVRALLEKLGDPEQDPVALVGDAVESFARIGKATDEQKDAARLGKAFVVLQCRDLLREIVSLVGAEFIEELADRIARPRRGKTDEERLIALHVRVQAADCDDSAGVVSCLGAADAKTFLASVLAPAFTQAISKDLLDESARAKQLKALVGLVPARAEAWIRTPTVVVSSPADLQMVGGHDIGAATTRVVADATVARGSAKVVDAGGVRTIRLHPSQEAGASQLVRAVARHGDTAAAEAWANSVLARLEVPAPRKPLTAMYDKAEIPKVPDLPGKPLGGARIEASAAERTQFDAATEGLRNGHVLVVSDSSFHLVGGPEAGVAVATRARSALVDHIVDRAIASHRAHQRFDLVAPGMSVQELRDLASTVRARMVGRGVAAASDDCTLFAVPKPASMLEQLNRRFALDRAEVEVATARPLPAGGHEVSIVIDLPVRASKQPLRIRVTARLQKLIQGLAEKVRGVFGRAKPTEDGTDLIRQIRLDLEGLGARDIVFELEGIVIADMEVPRDGAHQRRAA